jgi:hypothetical protein
MSAIRLILAGAAFLTLTSCEQKSHARFKPGDRVIERNNPSKSGIVYLRFNTDEPYYYLKVSGPPEGPPDYNDYNFLTDSDNDRPNLRVHIEGPFGDDDLRLQRH